MKSFYATISVSSMAHQGERFNIGLFISEGENVFFHYSAQKLKIISKLFSKSALELIRSSLQSIKQSVNEFDNKAESKTELLPVEKDFKHLSASYFEYLSRYNNNLIQFSKPKEIDLKVNKSIFQKLFQKFIYQNENFVVSDPVESPFTKEYDKFLTSASTYVNTNFQVTRDYISSLITPKKVDMFGKNGSYNLAHSIDFNTKLQTLKHKLDYFMYLALSAELAEDKHAKCFVLGEEPDKNSKNHSIWNNVRDLNEITYVPFDERERIIEHFRKEGVAPVI